MTVLIPCRKSRSFVTFSNVTEPFREDVVMAPLRSCQYAYLHEMYRNPYKFYQVITKPVETGDYKIKIQSVDDLDNVNTGTIGLASIVNAPLPPINVALLVKGSDVTLTWDPPSLGTVTSYIIYGNNGSGYVIDRTTPLATISGSLFTATLSSLANGEWRFVIESVVGGVQSQTLYLTHSTVPENSIKPAPIGVTGGATLGNAIKELNLTRVSVGKVKIKFRWMYGSIASQFNVYHDNATGTIDFTTPDFVFARQTTQIQEYTTTQLNTEDTNKTYKFFVRPENSLGNEYGDDVSDQQNAVSIEVDGVAPSEAELIRVDSIY